MVAHSYNPGIWETEAAELPGLCQLGLQRQQSFTVRFDTQTRDQCQSKYSKASSEA